MATLSLGLTRFAFAVAIPSALVVAGCMHETETRPRPAPASWAHDKAPRAARSSPKFDKSPAELEALIAKQTEGYAPDGDALTGKLEAFAGQPVPLQRGKCYRMVLRLGADASFSEHARKGISFVYRGIPGADEVNGGPGIAGPGGVGSAGCPQRDAPGAVFDIVAYSLSATDKSRIHELGTGGYTLQLFSKPVNDAALSAMAADEARQHREVEEFKRTDGQQRCGECRREKDLCLEGRRRPSSGSCVDDFDSCRFRSGVQQTCN